MKTSTILWVFAWLQIVEGFRLYPSVTLPRLSKMEMTATTPTPPAASEKKLPKVEGIKDRSNYLRDPLAGELENDEIFVSPDAVVILKYHGSYMQDDRDKRQKGVEKKYTFMLRLKSPGGEVPSSLYLKLNELCEKYGIGDLRASTRQAWQLHGIIKGDLKTVISTIIKEGSSTIGACGDVNRNVMCTPAPFVSPEYTYARTYAKILSDLFKPQSAALTELWLGDEKVADVEYWLRDLPIDVNVQQVLRTETGSNVITSDPVEPIYGSRYLPRKFKIGVTVPGDNSLDLLTNDIGLVVLTRPDGSLEGFNVYVGGGMGRTHMKESTFARVADPLGFVAANDILEACKAIVAVQRDHGNRDVRPNARMKYLVHEKGIDAFRSLVETYFGKPIQPFRELPEWRNEDWMGWHEQGDGRLFLGINVEQGRVRDYDSSAIGAQKDAKVKSLMYKLVKDFNLDMVLTPTQSIILKDIKVEDRDAIDRLLLEHRVLPIEEVDNLVRRSMACVALPTCGLAITEAERRMPTWMLNMRALLNRLGLGDRDIVLRMTGCPNGCARPYMAELALVGDGPDSYQIWVGGTPNLTHLASVYANKAKWENMDATLEPLLVQWKQQGAENESFGVFCRRVGVEALQAFAANYVAA